MHLSLPRRPGPAAEHGEPRRPLRLIGSVAAIALFAGACVGPAATGSPSAPAAVAGASQVAASTPPPVQPARTTPSPSPAPSVSPSATAVVPPVIATFLVGQQASFSVRLVTAEQIAQAQLLERDGGGPQIPVGTIVRTASPDNPGYAWHLDPTTFTFENQPSPDCEGLPSAIDGGSLASATTFCPMDTTVIRIEPAS